MMGASPRAVVAWASDKDGKDYASCVPSPKRHENPLRTLPSDVRLPQEWLQDILLTLQTGGQAARQLAATQGLFTFLYKGRNCRGSALHVSVQCEEGLQATRELLELSADVHAECRYRSLGKDASALPVHLAVQSGDTAMLSALLDAGASFDARAKRDGEAHFYPLHEAAFFRNGEMAAFMLEHGAHVNCVNLAGMTPLHVSAKNGAANVAEVLLKYSANPEIIDSSGHTALKVAVMSGAFPHRRLHMLARWRIEDIMSVAEHCPCAVAGFMRDLSREHNIQIQSVHKACIMKRFQHCKQSLKAHWIDLMDEAPEGGCLLFDILTVEPEEDNFFYHPLPAQAVVKELHCTYKTDTNWSCETETGDPTWPEWHDLLAPSDDPARRMRRWQRRHQFLAGGSSATKSLGLETRDMLRGIHDRLHNLGIVELNPVHIRQLRLPGVVCPEVFQALTDTPYLAIFEREATQSILEYTWRSFVRNYYTVQLVHRAFEITVLVTWTFYESTWVQDNMFSEWTKRCCWSVILVSSLRETIRELSQALGHIITGDYRAYFGNGWNYLDWAVIGMFNAFSWTSMEDLNLNRDPRIFAGVALFRWLQLLYTLRAYSIGKLGIRSIIPILHSLKEIGGMLIICLFTFVGFTHAFLVLDQNPDNWQAIVVDSFRFLFLGDGDGINTMLTLGAYKNSASEITVAFAFLVLAVLVFCVSLLNLFIAVHGEAYAQANRDSHALHLQERAALSLHCMMQPQWPPPECIARRLGCFGRRLQRPVVAYVVLSVVTVPTWMGLLYIKELSPAVTSIMMLVLVFLGNCFLVQRPWESEKERRDSIIWWCAPVHERVLQDEAQRTRGPEFDDITKTLGYLESRTDDVTRHLEQLDEKLTSLLASRKDKEATADGFGQARLSATTKM